MSEGVIYELRIFLNDLIQKLINHLNLKIKEKLNYKVTIANGKLLGPMS